MNIAASHICLYGNTNVPEESQIAGYLSRTKLGVKVVSLLWAMLVSITRYYFTSQYK